MKTYRFFVACEATMYIDVKAKTLAAAVEAAQNAPVMTLCHHCAASKSGVWSTTGELDMEPGCGRIGAVYEDEEDVTKEAVEMWT